MSEFNTELCETCPKRGLCVGEVALSILPITYDKGENGFPGFRLKATDEDGVANTIVDITSESYTVSTRKGEKAVPTSDIVGIRSDAIFTALQSNPEAFKDSIANRAKSCAVPNSIEHTSGFAVTYEKECRATARTALEALAIKANASPQG